MAEPKTKPSDASVDHYLASRANAEQLKDCEALIAGSVAEVERRYPGTGDA